MNKLTIKDVNIKGKRIFISGDFNVPLDKENHIADDSRIRAVLPTINYCLDEGAKVILASHMGRPKGEYKPELSLGIVGRRLERLLHKKIAFVNDCIGDRVKQAVDAMRCGDVVLLENLRFHKEETENDDNFSKQLAGLADIYVNDAFATAHRCHASNVGITKHIHYSVAGFLMINEIKYFERAMESPVRPLAAILGGAKVSSKIGVIENLLTRVDKVIIGGGMTFTFLKALGYEVGKSLVEDDMLETASRIITLAKENKVKFYLPVDCVVADKFDARAETKKVPIQEIPKEWIALDIGPASITLFAQALENAKTIIWNGPMGVFEMDAFSRGTMAMVNIVSSSYALTIVGGGDTDVAVHRAGESYKISYISTGGGAFLQLLEGKALPGLTALTDKGK